MFTIFRSTNTQQAFNLLQFLKTRQDFVEKFARDLASFEQRSSRYLSNTGMVIASPTLLACVQPLTRVGVSWSLMLTES